MQTYGVIWIDRDPGLVVYVGPASDPVDACNRAVKEQTKRGTLTPFTGSPEGDPVELVFSVYDVTGLIEPIARVSVDDEAALAVMTEETFVYQFTASRKRRTE